MTRRRPRNLRPDEDALWRRVAATAVPLRPEAQKPAFPGPVQPDPPAPAPDPPGPRAPQPAATRIAAPPQPRMDARLQARLRRGKMRPEGRIDLHGMRLDEAHSALQAFVMSSHRRGRRFVLVITGKGTGGEGDGFIPERRGVLRRQVPHWLTAPPLAPLVQEVMPAHRSHGGEGALYVYLRRRAR